RSADELRAAVGRLIGDATTADAVWRDGTATNVRVRIGNRAGRVACLRGAANELDSVDWVLRMPIAGRASSGDGRIDMPLDELAVEIAGGEITRAALTSR